MKVIMLPNDRVKKEDTATLESLLLERVVKLRKITKEMNENVHVQKAQDALELAKAPFKKARQKWMSEIEALELELKSRNIRYNIKYDDIFSEDDN